ncbi:MAG: MOSC domain-containing protein, partial [Anaerolineales bacterium]
RHGATGDRQADRRYHGGELQALCLFAVETLDILRGEGVPVFPGALGENFTTEGLDYRRVRVGDVYRTASRVEFEITKPRVPCATIQVYSAGIIKRLWGPSVPWGESGFYARVNGEGTARAGDDLELLRPGAAPPPPFTRKAWATYATP